MARIESGAKYQEISRRAEREISNEFFGGDSVPASTPMEIIANYQPPLNIISRVRARMYASEVLMKRLNSEEIGTDKRPVTLPRAVKLLSDFTLIGDQFIQYASIITGRDLDGRKIDHYERVTRLLGVGVDQLSGFIPFLESSHINSWVIDWVGDTFKKTTPEPLKRQLEQAVEEDFRGHSEAREAAFNRGLTASYSHNYSRFSTETPYGLGMGINKVRRFLEQDRTAEHIAKTISDSEASLSLKVRNIGLKIERGSAVDHLVRAKEDSVPEAYLTVDALRRNTVALGLFAIALSTLSTVDAAGMSIGQLGEIGASINSGDVLLQSGLSEYLGNIGQATNLFFGEIGNLINNFRNVAIAGGATLGAHLIGDPYRSIKQTSTIIGPAIGKGINKMGGLLEFLRL